MKIHKKKNLIEAIAHKEGVSPDEVRKEIELAIEAARHNPDPEKQENFKEVFGDCTPTLEEFILKIAKLSSK